MNDWTNLQAFQTILEVVIEFQTAKFQSERNRIAIKNSISLKLDFSKFIFILRYTCSGFFVLWKEKNINTGIHLFEHIPYEVIYSATLKSTLYQKFQKRKNQERIQK